MPDDQELLNFVTSRAIEHACIMKTKKDYNKAVAWCKMLAIVHEDPMAWNFLGYAYSLGLGVVLDNEKAYAYYRKAAKAGIASAQFTVALMLEKGRGTQQDRSLARRWLQKAAAQNYKEAQYKLGRIEEELYRNFEEAKRLYELAASSKGLPKATAALAYIFEHGLRVAKDMNRAIDLYTEAAEGGDRGAQRHLGKIYLAGITVEADHAKALHYSGMAAQYNDKAALMRLCKMHLRGQAVPADLDMAEHYCEKAYMLGQTNAREIFRRWKRVAIPKPKRTIPEPLL